MLTFSMPNFSQLLGLSAPLQRPSSLSRGGPLSSAGQLITDRLYCAKGFKAVKLTASALKDGYTESCKNLMKAIQPVQDMLQKFWGTNFVLSWHNHYADVRMALDKLTKKKYAMKTVRKDNAAPENNLYDEAECWSMLQDSSVVAELEGVYEDNRSMYFVYELCRGGDLQQLLETHGMLSELEAAQVVHALLTLLTDCHHRGVVYGPPHPERLGVARMYPSWAYQQGLTEHPGLLDMRAVDFTACSKLQPGQQQVAVPRGSAWYMAPEMLTQSFGHEADVWGVGVLMYQMLSGELPFCSTLTHTHQTHVQPCREAILSAITHNQLHFNSPAWAAISPEAKQLISSMLQRSPAHRICPQAALSHPWFEHLRTLAADSALNVLELPADEEAMLSSLDNLAEDPLDSLDDVGVCEIMEIGQPGGAESLLGGSLGTEGCWCGGGLGEMSLVYRTRLAAQLPDLNTLRLQLMSPATLALVVVVSGWYVFLW